MKKLIFAGAAVAALLTAMPAVALAEEEPTPCGAATAALEDGQAKKARLDTANETLSAARERVAELVVKYGVPFDVNTATAVDAENAVAYLREMRNALVVNGAVIDQPKYDELSRDMDTVKALRDALNEHQAAAEAALTVDLAALEKAKADACTPTTETPDPTTPDPTTPADSEDVNCEDVPQDKAQDILDADPSDPHNLDADNDGVACEVEEGNLSQVGDVPVGGVDTGLA